MNTKRERAAQVSSDNRSLVSLALLALVVGATTGLMCAGFRIALRQADRFRDILIGWAHGHAILGFVLVVVTCSLATFLGAWLVFRFSPHAWHSPCRIRPARPDAAGALRAGSG